MAHHTTRKFAWVAALALSGGCATEVQEPSGAEPTSGAGGGDSGSGGSAGNSGGSASGSSNKGGAGAGGVVGQSGSNMAEAGTSGSAPQGGSGGGGAGGMSGGNAGGGAGGKGGAGGNAGMGGKAGGGAGGMSGAGGTVQPNPCGTGKLTITGGAASTTELPEFSADKAWDGDTTVSRWASAVGEPNSIYVDLGEVAHVSRVRLFWEAAYATSYRVERSNTSNGGWTVMQSVTNGDGGTDNLTTLTAGNGRYIQIVGVTRATAYGFSLYEIEVYGDLDETCN